MTYTEIYGNFVKKQLLYLRPGLEHWHTQVLTQVYIYIYIYIYIYTPKYIYIHTHTHNGVKKRPLKQHKILFQCKVQVNLFFPANKATPGQV